MFLATGYKAMGDFVRAARSAGLDPGETDAAFELGCGGGRLIRHLRAVDGMRLVGSDLLADNAAWCRENLDGIEFHQNGLEPPLDFADDGSFDFAFAYSVFTHIPMELQLPWIEELARVLRPGGVATVTVLGPDMAQTMMSDDEFEQFTSDGHYTMDSDHPRVSRSSALIGSWDIFMTDDHVQALYGQALEVMGQRSGGAVDPDAPQAAGLTRPPLLDVKRSYVAPSL